MTRRGSSTTVTPILVLPAIQRRRRVARCVALLAVLVTGLISWGVSEGVSQTVCNKYAYLINAELQAQPPNGRVPTRRVGRVRPAGIREAADIYEVVVPPEQGGSGLSRAECEAYQQGYLAYQQGDFRSAMQLLRQVPLDDPIGSFLTKQCLHLQDEELGSDWEGVLEFRSK